MDVYNNVSSSLIKFCSDFIEDNGFSLTTVPFDFDAHATVAEFPEKDLIGISEYMIENIDRQYIVSALICVCTQADDSNLQRLRPLIGGLFGKLIVGSSPVIVVDSEIGVPLGHLTVLESVKVLPVSRSITRPLQMIGVHFGSSFTTPP